MVSPSTILGGLSLALSLQGRKEAQEQREQEQQAREIVSQDTDDTPDTLPAEVQATQGTRKAVERLAAIEETNQPSPEDTDAFVSASVTLADGETAEITVTPQDGQVLHVKKVHIDRYDDHIYTINVAGDTAAVAHRAVYSKPRPVRQSDRVVAEITNDSGSETTLDFEVEAWGEVR